MRPVRHALATTAFLASMVALDLARPPCAHAYPFLPPRPISSAIAGPTDPHVAATFYNPAALGPLRGAHLWIDSGPRLHLGKIERADISPGRPGGDATINWSDFDAFVGLSWDLNTDTITVGLATLVPFVDLTRFDDPAVQYQAVRHRLVTYEQMVSVALRLGSRFYVGAGANFAETWIRHRFARDAALDGGSDFVSRPNPLCGEPCGLENPLAAQQVTARGFGFGIGFSVGVLYRPIDRLWLGLSYVSHFFNADTGGDLHLEDPRGARVSPCPSPTGSCLGDALVLVAVPDILYFGARVEATPRIEVEAQFRWVHYSARAQVDYKLQGGDLGRLPAPPLPPEMRIDHGLDDAFAVGISGRFRVSSKLRLAPALMYESAAVEPSAVSAAALDGHKLDATLIVEWRPVRRLRLGAHLGGTGYFLGDVNSRFDPNDRVACVDAHYSLKACGAVESGGGLPSAQGHYTLFVLHFGGAIGLDF